MTLGQLSAQKKNVILLRGWEYELDLINASWNKTQNSNPERVGENCIKWAKSQKRSPSQLLDSQTQITPDQSNLPSEVEILDRGLKSWAKWTNYILKFHLVREIAGYVNIISMDWINDQVIEQIIDSNEKNSEQGKAKLTQQSQKSKGKNTTN